MRKYACWVGLTLAAYVISFFCVCRFNIVEWGPDVPAGTPQRIMTFSRNVTRNRVGYYVYWPMHKLVQYSGWGVAMKDENLDV